MSVNISQISNPSISIKPSQKLKNYILNLKVKDDMPLSIKNIVFKNKIKDVVEKKPAQIRNLISNSDMKFIKSLNLSTHVDFVTQLPPTSKECSGERLLSLHDMHWLYKYIQTENETNYTKTYLHELLEESEIVLPKNEIIPRNEELNKRCIRLKAEQENKDYHKMTKNVDSLRKKLPEDTISYQLKQMNRQLLAVFQFIFSVATGFLFGFLGVELIIGELDFGFRLLLGIICALIIALAELYFLAKTLNEDLQIEYAAEKSYKNIKVD